MQHSANFGACLLSDLPYLVLKGIEHLKELLEPREPIERFYNYLTLLAVTLHHNFSKTTSAPVRQPARVQCACTGLPGILSGTC